MTLWVGVLPFVHRPWRDACAATMAPDFLAHVLEIDNTATNLGIMRSHNLGIDRMREAGADWLVVISAAVRFGAPGGLDFITQLAEHPGHHVIEGPCWTPDSGGNGVYGWHLIAFHRRTIEAAGRWDENYTPYGPDDLDLSLRIQRVFGLSGQLWEKVPCDVTDAGMAHGINLAGVHVPNAVWQRDYFIKKWGRHPDHSQVPAYDRPFNDPTLPLAYWPTAANGGRWDA